MPTPDLLKFWEKNPHLFPLETLPKIPREPEIRRHRDTREIAPPYAGRIIRLVLKEIREGRVFAETAKRRVGERNPKHGFSGVDAIFLNYATPAEREAADVLKALTERRILRLQQIIRGRRASKNFTYLKVCKQIATAEGLQNVKPIQSLIRTRYETPAYEPTSLSPHLRKRLKTLWPRVFKG